MVDGTGQWLLSSQEFIDWMSGPASSLLWVYGKAGSGKSHVACRAIDELCFHCDSTRRAASQNGELVAVAFVYCSSLAGGQNDPKVLLGSILKQLISQVPIMADLPPLPKAFGGEQETAFPGEITIGDIKSGIKALSAWFSRTFIVIDGLDECFRDDELGGTTAGRRPDSRNFQRLCEFISTLTKDADTTVSVKTLVLSRPDYLEIEDAFSGCARIQADNGANEDDVKRYITQEVENMKLEVIDEIKDQLLAGSEGMFLWVQICISMLKKEYRSARDMRDAPTRFPRSLDSMYELSLLRVMREPNLVRNRALTALMWTANAQRPLSRAEMHQLLGVRSDAEDLEETYEVGQYSGLTAECGDLIHLVNDQYRLIHTSLQEFLSSSITQTGDYRELQIQQAEIMAETCLVFLNFRGFSRGPATVKDELQELVRKQPFFAYAASQWGIHLRDVPERSARREQLYGLVTKFLRSDANRELSRQLLMSLNPEYEDLVFPVTKWSTPLHLMACFDLVKLAETFSDIVTQLDCRDMFESTPVDEAFRCQCEQMAIWLLTKHLELQEHVAFPRVIEGEKSKIFSAVQNSWLDALETLVKLGDNVDQPFHGTWPLHEAAEKGDVEIISKLLSLNAEVDCINDSGETPLYQAALGGKTAAVLRLIEANADVTIASSDILATPLHAAAQLGDIDAVRALINEGANVGAKLSDGRTPLYLGVLFDKIPVVRFLLQQGADSNASGSTTTCLQLAARNGSEECIKLLLAHGATVDTLNNDGCGAAHFAAANGRLSCIHILAGKLFTFECLIFTVSVSVQDIFLYA
jgi:hypothetical protein